MLDDLPTDSALKAADLQRIATHAGFTWKTAQNWYEARLRGERGVRPDTEARLVAAFVALGYGARTE